jgi:hypothetical protein
MFGNFKFGRSKNPLNGVTSYVLLLPLPAKIGTKDNSSRVDCKDSLEDVFMKNLTVWSKNNLTEKIAVKRKYKLAG